MWLAVDALLPHLLPLLPLLLRLDGKKSRQIIVQQAETDTL